MMSIMSNEKRLINFTLPASQWKAMEAQVRRCLPEEACGFIIEKELGRFEALAVTNALHSPVRFRMEPIEQLELMNQMDENDWRLAGIYHSHPQGPDHPSATDLAEAAYPQAVTLIWFPRGNGWDCRAFMLADGAYTEIPVDLV
jgi:[CysO sulfur-carrier protein]-S-L-cysteine hydrolase